MLWIDFSLLKRNRNFKLLYIGQFVSFFGTMITGVALPYQVYQETHSTLWVGLLSLVQLLPVLLTALIGGTLADRYPRRKLLYLTEVMLAGGCLLLMLNATFPHPSLIITFSIAALMSATTGIHRPALESLTQQLVDSADYAEVSILSSFKFSLSMIAGPAIAGLSIAHTGLIATYALDLCTFLVAITTLVLISYFPPASTAPAESTLQALKGGFQYAWSKPELMGSYWIDFIAMIFGMPTALFPAIAQQYGDAKVLGLFYSAPAVGALIISLFSGWTKNIKRHGAAISLSAGLWGIAIILFGLSSNIVLALFFLSLSGMLDAISGMFRQRLWNETIPPNYRGRLAGIEMVSYLSGPKLGDTEAGLVAALCGVSASVVSGGVLCVLGVAICTYFLPKFWHYQVLDKNQLN